MKKLTLLILILLLSSIAFGQNIKVNKNTKLLVYYFHLTNRCKTCTSIEAATIKTLDEYFKTEIDSGIIIFETFNVEIPDNKILCEKYQAYGATLALTKIEFGKEVNINDLTNFAFSKINLADEFMIGLKKNIDEWIK